MPSRFLHALPLLVLLPACAPSVRVPVLQPALVNTPAEVQTIGVIDRSAPANVGESILGALEGVLTGEDILADREGAQTALRELVHTLEQSPRFEVVIPNVTKDEADSGIFSGELDYRDVKRICRKAGCDALVALEAFDSDSWLHVDGNPINDGHQYDDVTVSRSTRVLAAWRMYDAKEDRLLDESREWRREETWDHYGETLSEARSGLPSQDYTIRFLGEVMGHDYGARIAPTWFNVSRYYYASGHPDLKQAKHHVRANDWDGAKKVWRSLLDDPDPKVRGKAEFNMALALEVDGALERAHEMAKKAAVDLHNGKARSYVWTLERRIDEQAQLEAQLAPPPPKEKPASGPRGGKEKPPAGPPDDDTDTDSDDDEDDDAPTTMSRPR